MDNLPRSLKTVCGDLLTTSYEIERAIRWMGDRLNALPETQIHDRNKIIVGLRDIYSLQKDIKVMMKRVGDL